ncbi:1,4-dihydroxy-2-naphthoate polyprenyltransferase [Clostridium isatidis]|uniref:1,4-dihydroxy-2-naphthoate polyprenyltransferase n=1 Tax=Clostridium isatidis TaxID=182773 RepID=A0A343J9K9_9CLOT|nr:1,4-dihydroxy-2-naphthoate polyprenyltransferase [Clostridium isatidis]ASW42217.1 1,4-dihydroxy-2-naphthoate polyprenyltransferase [Clostridium isatidis]
MKIKSFLKLVEIQTKAASVIPYFLASLFVYYRYNIFNFKNAIIMFFSMLIFDMTTTAINNYIDYAKAIKKEGFGYESHNAIVRDKLNPDHVRYLIYAMLGTAALLGLLLVANTNIVVLLLGALAFVIGITYTFGPIPISRTPFGELFSGLAMGFLLTFITMYIHIFDRGILNIDYTNFNSINIVFNLKELVILFIVCLPAITGIANIMLANNICDIEDDIVNKRYTLPIYIGKENALKLFKWLYYIGYMAIVIAVVIRVLPLYSLLSVLVLKKVKENIDKFNELQTKKDTFGLAVENFALTNIVLAITILVGVII